ncbi:SymE family type I addiction module toxin [Leclercia adecarboxylata]|uniref:SymE family type I addiction module toxin n=1 Tax=Leclercia adecarboxylata TaxID=83655 RepID=UPI0013C55D06|nr:SymE family type I addiction module toxin [Leclercia adecarboxylata]NEG94501.1 type I addiction module toxin, SymE family [Leclercia adecarboxylata]
MTDIDCIAESLQPEVFESTDRVFTVSYATRFGDYTRTPAFIMKGLWLNEAGFSTGTKVDVKVMKGCMILTSRQDEPEIETLMREVSQLSDQKQKQVMDFVGVISGKLRKA